MHIYRSIQMYIHIYIYICIYIYRFMRTYAHLLTYIIYILFPQRGPYNMYLYAYKSIYIRMILQISLYKKEIYPYDIYLHTYISMYECYI